MNSRLATLFVFVLSLALAAPAWGSTSGGVGVAAPDASSAPAQTAAPSQGGGGAAAETVRPGAGGGGAAPAGSGAEPVVPETPAAEAAQDEPTPTTPEGQPQEPEPELPDDDGGSDDGTATTPTGDGGPATEQLPGDGDGTASTSTLGFLPTTGLEVAALALIGLGLMIGGIALLRPARP